MKSKKNTYNNSKRLIEAENTKLDIIKAFGRLWMKYSIKEITLNMISEEAGVTTRTILRKFGSKERLLEECIALDAANIMQNREQGMVGDIEHMLNILLASYESMGEAAMRTINLEPEMEIAQKIGETGRKKHREWCARMFDPFLPEPDSPQYEIDLTAFIASTEIYLWKLMRKDLKMSEEQTFSVFKKMIEGLAFKH